MPLARLLPALALVTLFARTAHAEEEDPWWGRDKALHFGVSAGLAAGGYAASTPFVDERWQRASIGAGFALTLGAGKELYDWSGAGHASFKDFTWDVAGAAVGTAIALAVDLALSSRDDANPSGTAIVHF